MYVVIAGGGLFGQGLAARLVEGRHDVVVVESDRAVCENVSSKVGALVLCGSATSIDVLEEAGIRKADVAVGAMPADADNLAFAVLARNFNVPRVITRMRDPQFESAYKLAGVSMAVNISEMFIRQLVVEIEQPSVRHVASFGKGHASIVVTRLPEGELADGKNVKDIANDEAFPAECVIAGIYREESEEFIFPRGPAELRAGDQVFLAAPTASVRKATQFLRRTE